MSALKILDDIYRQTLNLIFPIACLVCGQGEQYLCRACGLKLLRVDKQKCLPCQQPSPFGKTHDKCLTRNTVNGAVAALPYKNQAIKKLIQIYKYKFVSDLSPTLTALIHESIKDNGLEAYFTDLTLVPVPLHKRRLQWRGFNQSEVLARDLSEFWHSPIDTALVSRVRNTKPQVNLNNSERKQNIKNAFVVHERANGNFLIVDDVVTTGSTLNEIARVLKRAGAKEVWALTLAAD